MCVINFLLDLWMGSLAYIYVDYEPSSSMFGRTPSLSDRESKIEKRISSRVFTLTHWHQTYSMLFFGIIKLPLKYPNMYAVACQVVMGKQRHPDAVQAEDWLNLKSIERLERGCVDLSHVK